MKCIRKPMYWMSFAVLVFGFSAAGSLIAQDNNQGVYEYVVQKSPLSFEAASQALAEAIEKSDFRLVGQVDQAAPDTCSYKTRVFVLYDSEYAQSLLAANDKTGAFAVPDRINLFEDEAGLHVAIVNPLGINRTILMDDQKFDGLSSTHRGSLRALIQGAVSGESSDKPFGPIRKKGYIGRTMGIMAGGPFDKKIENVLVAPTNSLTQAVDNLKALFVGDGKWGMKPAYSLILEDSGIAILGVTSPAIETKSFNIVKAGGDKSRKEYSCPGTAHAAAYPIEIVFIQKQTVVWVRLLDTMYRMKMFFEDAGKMAFAKNMGMPGSIKKEIKKKIKQAFEKD